LIAVVEAKREYKTAAKGMQQAKKNMLKYLGLNSSFMQLTEKKF